MIGPTCRVDLEKLCDRPRFEARTGTQTSLSNHFETNSLNGPQNRQKWPHPGK
jgi:hypothetical protein